MIMPLVTCFLTLQYLKSESDSVVQLFATPWTVTCQAPLPKESSRQEDWSEFHSLLLWIFLSLAAAVWVPLWAPRAQAVPPTQARPLGTCSGARPLQRAPAPQGVMQLHPLVPELAQSRATRPRPNPLSAGAGFPSPLQPHLS